MAEDTTRRQARSESLLRTEHIDIDRDAAIYFDKRWYAGDVTLSLLFSVSRHRSALIERATKIGFAAIYPLRVSRYALLRILGRKLIFQ